MGIKHFSHQHKLFSFETLEIGEKANCKACESSISKPFHGCKQCKFYIHDECLNAPRWLKHPSHPAHSLVLMPTPTYSSGGYACNACKFKSHGFSLSCVECSYDVHLRCANSPATVRVDGHPHELKLMFDAKNYQEKTAINCGVCAGTTDHKRWLYYCAPCEFYCHLRCATKSDKQFEWVTDHLIMPNATDHLIMPNDQHDSTTNLGCVVHKTQQQQRQIQDTIDLAPSHPSSGSLVSAASASDSCDAAHKILIKEAMNEMITSQIDQMKTLTKMLNTL